MKIKCLSIIICVLAHIYSCAQYQATNWPMVYNDLMVKITPDTFERDSLTEGSVLASGFSANASVSDARGNLLLYSFGYNVNNKEGGVVDSGCCLSIDTLYSNVGYLYGSPHMQGALILPRPGSTLQYYLFLKDEDEISIAEQPTRITATLVDMSYNNGLGKVLQRAVPILNTILSDARMTACQHGNGRDWWLINHQYNTNRIYTHLITPDSILGPFNQNIGLAGLEPDATGWSIFSPVSNTFATTTQGMGKITLLDFDRCNGTFDNFREINTTTGDSGNYCFLAFSPNGRFLYAGNFNYIMQYDLMDTDSITGVQVIHDTAQSPYLGMMDLMPDDKIYVANWTTWGEYLSVIDSPDVKCPACGFHLRSVYVPNSELIPNVPNFPNYNLGALKGSGCDTITDIGQQALDSRLIQLQPNPADDYVTIKIAVPGDYEVRLLNELGQVLEIEQIDKTGSFNTMPLSSGLYFVQAINKQGTKNIITKKLIIAH